MQEQIKELLERYIRGECTEKEIALLEKWYDRIVIDDSARMPLKAADEERLVREFWEAVAEKEKGAGEPATEEPQAKVRRMRRVWGYAAVWAGLIIVSGGLWLHWKLGAQRTVVNRPMVFTEVATGYQQVRKVMLPDSSVVWLNSATHLSFHPDFTMHREVRLSGEAFFEVRTDADHPFIVEAGGASTRVFGTAFNVSAYPEAGQLRVSLKSGKVGVAYGGGQQQVLVPGQLLVCDKRTGKAKVIQQATGEMDEWTDGRLLFYMTPLKEALAQIEARYGVHIVYDRAIKDGNITARFENTALEKVLAQLSFGWDLHFIRKGNILHVR